MSALASQPAPHVTIRELISTILNRILDTFRHEEFDRPIHRVMSDRILLVRCSTGPRQEALLQSTSAGGFAVITIGNGSYHLDLRMPQFGDLLPACSGDVSPRIALSGTNAGRT